MDGYAVAHGIHGATVAAGLVGILALLLPRQIGLVASSLIALAYVAIATAIIRPLARDSSDSDGTGP